MFDKQTQPQLKTTIVHSKLSLTSNSTSEVPPKCNHFETASQVSSKHLPSFEKTAFSRREDSQPQSFSSDSRSSHGQCHTPITRAPCALAFLLCSTCYHPSFRCAGNDSNNNKLRRTRTLQSNCFLLSLPHSLPFLCSCNHPSPILRICKIRPTASTKLHGTSIPGDRFLGFRAVCVCTGRASDFSNAKTRFFARYLVKNHPNAPSALVWHGFDSSSVRDVKSISRHPRVQSGPGKPDEGF